jgi:hypothetical protein
MKRKTRHRDLLAAFFLLFEEFDIAGDPPPAQPGKPNHDTTDPPPKDAEKPKRANGKTRRR